MALQDLTPQLRTRLGRVERVVGWFVLLAILLLAGGFVYYAMNTAQRKGWFVAKVTYSTGLSSAAGIKIGDPVRLMGSPIGEITGIVPNGPGLEPNMWVFFQVRQDVRNNCGYIWHDSKVRVLSADLLGGRTLEVTKGIFGVPTLLVASNDSTKILGMLNKTKIAEFDTKKEAQRMYKTNQLEADWDTNVWSWYKPFKPTDDYWLEPEESIAITERLEELVSQVQEALPNILSLTNQVAEVLNNSVRITTKLDELMADLRPVVTNANEGVRAAATTLTNASALVLDLRASATNLAVITAQLRDPRGSLGEWLIPTNINMQLEKTLIAANTTVSHTDTNLAVLVESLHRSLNNVASITSNLNAQVQANTNLLSEISSIVLDTDNLVQGLKKHWFLRSAFKTNAPPKTVTPKGSKPARNTKPFIGKQ